MRFNAPSGIQTHDHSVRVAHAVTAITNLAVPP